LCALLVAANWSVLRSSRLSFRWGLAGLVAALPLFGAFFGEGLFGTAVTAWVVATVSVTALASSAATRRAPHNGATIIAAVFAAQYAARATYEGLAGSCFLGCGGGCCMSPAPREVIEQACMAEVFHTVWPLGIAFAPAVLAVLGSGVIFFARYRTSPRASPALLVALMTTVAAATADTLHIGQLQLAERPFHLVDAPMLSTVRENLELESKEASAPSSIFDSVVRDYVEIAYRRTPELLRIPTPQIDCLDCGPHYPLVETILEHRAEIRKCSPGKTPRSRVTVVLRWRVGTTGRASDLEILGNGSATSAEAACLARVVQNIRFPARAEASGPITFPFNL
jgi:hypothetical protein